jgi:hypothetical protein
MTPEMEKNLCDDVRLIKQAVLGNDVIDQPGLVHKVTVLEKKQLAQDKRAMYLSGFIAAVTVGGKMAWDWFTGSGHK